MTILDDGHNGPAYPPLSVSLAALNRAFRHAPAGTRAHVLIRFLTCPFLRVLRYLPPDAKTLLDVGGGHGVFSFLAVRNGIHRAIVAEPDLPKLFVTYRDPAVTFVGGYDDVIGGKFDVVAFMDVLYAIPQTEWDPILARAAERLKPGGTLLVKEQDPRARIKNAWNRAQEWFSMKVLRLTLARDFAYETPEAFTDRLKRHGFKEIEAHRVDFGYPHPHILYVARI